MIIFICLLQSSSALNEIDSTTQNVISGTSPFLSSVTSALLHQQCIYHPSYTEATNRQFHDAYIQNKQNTKRVYGNIKTKTKP